MNRTFAIAKRILSQFAHDKRTLALLFVAPIVVIWLLSVLLGTSSYIPTVAAVDLPPAYQAVLEKQDICVKSVDEDLASELLNENKVDAVLSVKKGTTTLNIWAEGSDSHKTAAVFGAVADATSEFSENARMEMQKDIDAKKAEIEKKKAEAEQKRKEVKSRIEDARNKARSEQAKMKDKQTRAINDIKNSLKDLPPEAQTMLMKKFDNMFSGMGSVDTGSLTRMMDDIDIDGMDINTEGLELDMDIDTYMPIQDLETTYLHGSDEWEMFDFYGPIFIGIFIFAFTFITSGMSLVNEKSRGTMARFLATPVKSWQILGGYSLGFGLFSLVQAAVILVAALKFIGFPNEGSVALVICIAVSLAIASVTMGLLVSGLAENAFQVVQLMLMFVVPQILLSGLFDLSSAPGWLQAISQCLPLTYGVDAMKEVMLRGTGIQGIGMDLAIVWGFIAVFFILAALGFRKKSVRKQGTVLK